MTEGKVTVPDIIQAKKDGRKLVMVTAYDYPFGLMADEAGVDMALVGDSLGMVVLGLDSTVPVTLEMMIHHIQAVVRGCKRAMVIGDMPFMSYNISIREAIHNAGRLMKEGGCDAIKLEGGVGHLGHAGLQVTARAKGCVLIVVLVAVVIIGLGRPHTAIDKGLAGRATRVELEIARAVAGREAGATAEPEGIATTTARCR